MSKISWTDQTWNPVVGCTKCSPGCLNCYAEKMAVRLYCISHAKKGKSTLDKYGTVIDRGQWNGKIYCDESALDKPLHWKKPRKIFVCSMGDLFHPGVPFGFIHQVWGVMKACPQHTFQILTKRPKIMMECVSRVYSLERFGWAKGFWSHVKLGVSISTQKEAYEKLPILAKIPAAYKFVSFEPLLERIHVMPKQWDGIDGVIIGAESKGRAAGRLCDNEWVWELAEEATLDGLDIHIKQLHINGKLVKDKNKFPPDLQIQDEI